MPCDAVDFVVYEGTPLRKFDTSAYFFVTERMSIDADGAPNAYHPNDTGIDALANAGFPNGSWRSILVVDPADATKPFVQPDGPFAGFHVSKTALQDSGRPETDINRYVDSTRVPYVVFPATFHNLTGTGTMGDLVVARNLSNSKVSSAIVADVGPAHARLGEVSIRLAERLGGSHVNPRNGSGMPKGSFLYMVFPMSHAKPKWPVSVDQIDALALSKLDAIGGWDRLLACVAGT